ncbi:hypothetical protein NDU88_001609 [Pleurodeles waltl]|uniref:Uncharacterized protein n=1 Tax=Pleurodeles waltl TaxID=8319 RepID=A0AAV7LA96_PLEWA|nr:hypothetical protein NDU88_001609 [Pleurodeles waltl]
MRTQAASSPYFPPHSIRAAHRAHTSCSVTTPADALRVGWPASLTPRPTDRGTFFAQQLHGHCHLIVAYRPIVTCAFSRYQKSKSTQRLNATFFPDRRIAHQCSSRGGVKTRAARV